MFSFVYLAIVFRLQKSCKLLNFLKCGYVFKRLKNIQTFNVPMVLFLDHKIINVSKEVCLLVVVVVREI